MSDNSSISEMAAAKPDEAPKINHVLLQNVQIFREGDKAYVAFHGMTERICMPLEMLGWLHQELDRLAIALAGTLDPLQKANIATPKTWRTASTQEGLPTLVIDHGLPSQQAFAMDPDVAVELGEQLAAIGAQGLRPIHTH
ncbi:hypothetical protein [Bradyrhizobium sp. STM 3561]|uniref:hypothetical protein n=1 Tax=Bradyrhizobium sp. STM 3561 TaxID=578923 RepID=UPI00388EE26C